MALSSFNLAFLFDKFSKRLLGLLTIAWRLWDLNTEWRSHHIKRDDGPDTKCFRASGRHTFYPHEHNGTLATFSRSLKETAEVRTIKSLSLHLKRPDRYCLSSETWLRPDYGPSGGYVSSFLRPLFLPLAFSIVPSLSSTVSISARNSIGRNHRSSHQSIW